MSILKKDYLPGHLAAELDHNGLNGSIAVQASQSERETVFLTALAHKHPIIRGVVGWADLRARNIDERLACFVESSPKIRGFRHVVHDEPDVDFMLQTDFMDGIGQLEKYGLTYDILIFPVHLRNTLRFVKAFPNQKFVIDHIAKPYIETGIIDVWREYMLALGALDNVWCKLSGMVTEARWHQWAYDDFLPYLEVVFDAFGTDRLMFGSDWPVCLLSGTYGEMKGIVDRYITAFTPQEQNKIMGGNAASFYGIA